MVIERFKDGDSKAVYRRLRDRGRMAPEGLTYVDSWVEVDRQRCFQLMACENPDLIRQWTAQWSDLIEFEIVPVRSSQETAAAVFAELDSEVEEGPQGRQS